MIDRLFLLLYSLLFSFLLIVSFPISAQSVKNSDIFIEGGISYGSAIYHPLHDIYLKDLYFGRLEFRLGKQASGKELWERLLNYPVYGITLRYTDYTDFFDPATERKERNKVMGKNIALFGYLQTAIVRAKWFTWHFQLGLGAAAFTQIYKEETVYKPTTLLPDPNTPNHYIDEDGESKAYPDNDLISLYVNPYVNLQMGFDFKLNRQFDLCVNAGFNHASNANMNMPNYGINEIQGIVNLRYHFNPNYKIMKMDTFSKYQPLNSLFFTVDPGWLFARYDDNYYLKVGTSIGYMRKILPILNVGASIEICYARFLSHSKDYNYTEWEREDSPRIKMPKNIHTEAFYGFAELVFSRFAFHFGVGAYFNKGPGHAKKMDLAQNWDNSGTLKSYPVVYEKLGFRIYTGKKQHHFFGASIRAHFPVADYMAFVYGYKFFNFRDISKNKFSKI